MVGNDEEKVEEQEESEVAEEVEMVEAEKSNGLGGNDEFNEKKAEYDDDLQAYMAEMENLSSDFSDLDDIDMEELKEMQDAISKVQEGVESQEVSSETAAEVDEHAEYLEQKDALISDFSDLEEIDLDELKDMKDAIEGVVQEDGQEPGVETQQQQISAELEERIKAELAKKKEEEGEKVITPEMFLDYVKERREKIWYHALWHLVFEIDDHIASKELLYDILKEVTSKNAIDPIPYHQFVFGLGYILRLNINKKQVVRYMRNARFKINVNLDTMKEMLKVAGEPISRRPVITKDERSQMFKDFLNDDFLDI